MMSIAHHTPLAQKKGTSSFWMILITASWIRRAATRSWLTLNRASRVVESTLWIKRCAAQPWTRRLRASRINLMMTTMRCSSTTTRVTAAIGSRPDTHLWSIVSRRLSSIRTQTSSKSMPRLRFYSKNAPELTLGILSKTWMSARSALKKRSSTWGRREDGRIATHSYLKSSLTIHSWQRSWNRPFSLHHQEWSILIT